MDPTFDELAVLRHAQDRVLEREGIPMVLALVSEVGDSPAAHDDEVRADGARLAEQIERFRSAVLSTARDGDMGAVASVLQAVSYADFGAFRAPLPEPAQPVMRQEV